MRKPIALFLLVLASIPLDAARSFNGTSDSMSTKAATNLSAAGTTFSSLTFAISLKQTTFTTGDHLLLEMSSNYNTNCNGCFIIDTGGAVGGCSSGFYFAENITGTPSGTAYRARKFTSVPSAGVYHTYVIEMTSTSANWAAFVDGASQSLTNCDIGSPGTRTFSEQQIFLMSRNNASLFNAGSVAWWAIWKNVLLSANEAQALYACQNPWMIQPEALLHATWLTGYDSPEASYAPLQPAGQNTPVTGTAFTAAPPSACQLF